MGLFTFFMTLVLAIDNPFRKNTASLTYPKGCFCGADGPVFKDIASM
jgi:hypothetical protein